MMVELEAILTPLVASSRLKLQSIHTDHLGCHCKMNERLNKAGSGKNFIRLQKN